MWTVWNIYEEYNIMPALRLHQLRAGAVGKLVSDSIDVPLDSHSVILACLFHDMGNIVKSDFSQLPELIQEKGAAYWETVKADFTLKYGPHAHAANVAIAKEIGLPNEVVSLIDGISFGNIDSILQNDSFEQKIAEYADTRVGPHGILSQIERMKEAHDRSQARGKSYYTEEGLKNLSSAAAELERIIFEHTSIHPENITDESASPLVEELKHFQVG